MSFAVLIPLLDSMATAASSPFVPGTVSATGAATGVASATSAAAQDATDRTTAELAEYSTGRVELPAAEAEGEATAGSFVPEHAITGVGLGHALVAHTAPAILPTLVGTSRKASCLVSFPPSGVIRTIRWTL